MEVEEYARIAAAEDDHWWYRNTRALMAELLQPWLGTDQRILDAGCGPGGNGAWLASYGQVTGVDLAREALEFVRARRPATTPVQASAERLPFADGAFDVAVGITLLYTVRDDVAALGELARVLRTGGAVLLLEPAFESLRRAHDVTVHGLNGNVTSDLPNSSITQEGHATWHGQIGKGGAPISIGGVNGRVSLTHE